MDKLKEEIAKRKAKLGATPTGWVKKGEILKKQEEQYLLEQQKAEQQAKEKLEKQLAEIEAQNKLKLEKAAKIPPTAAVAATPLAKVNMAAAASGTGSNVGEKLAADAVAPEPAPIVMKLSNKEIINRLREHKQPITLFGEDDLARYNRLCKYESEVAGMSAIFFLRECGWKMGRD